MKKLILLLVLMVMLIPSSVNADDWRHHIYVKGSLIYLIHPSGDFWFFTCRQTPSGNTQCNWKK